MDCNKEEAIRAKEIAEKKMENNDFEGAQKIALRARNLYPELDNIAQLLSICDVHCSAQKRLTGSEKDWYGILQVEKLADEVTVKKQYRKLALTLHPDKNRFPGAEGAFKLICEANALLSDPSKKSIYDTKIRVSAMSASVNSQHNKQYGAQNNNSNGCSRLNQQEARATSFGKQDVFWTCCPYCKVRYQYLRQHINKSLTCPTCLRVFVTYEASAQGVPSGSKSDQQDVDVATKPNLSRPAVFQEKVVPDQGNVKMGVQDAKGPSASRFGSRGIPSKRTVQPESGVRTECGSEGIKLASVAGNLKTKETDNLNVGSVHGGDKGVTIDGDAILKKRRDLRNKNRKRGRKLVVESSDSSDTSSQTNIEDVTIRGNFGDPATHLKSESSKAQSWRSSRKRCNVSYKETDDGDIASPLKRAQAPKKDRRKEEKDAMDIEESDHGNQNSFPTAADDCKSKNKERGSAHSRESLKEKDTHCNKEGKMGGVTDGKPGAGAATGTVEIESDSDRDMSSSKNSDTDLCHCPDPEFSDFDKVRDESHFDVNQFWACYDTLDGMPRFYAKVKKVCASPFELHITWLEAVPIDEAYEKWVDEELPVGCGNFKLGKTEKTSVRLSFSHQVHCEKGKKRGGLIINPREGEVWALFKDWNMSWSSDPENHKEFKYEIVEVLTDFVPGIGIKVAYLDKLTGFVSLFQRATESESNSFQIVPHELYKFSHRVPCFKMTGTEREGVPIGSFELDPASIPLDPNDLYYPSKAKIECRNTVPGGGSSLQKNVESEGTTNAPQAYVDLEGVEGEMSKVRKSPRGQKVIKQNPN